MRRKPYQAVLAAQLALAAFGSSQTKKPAAKAATSAPNKALLQKVWDGWSTLAVANVKEYYATGPHTFFDIAPLKYSSWDDYQKGVVGVLAGFKTAKFTVNDDAEIHGAGEYYWGLATVKEDATLKSGKREMSTFRWTFVFAKQDGTWLIVHEHVSALLQ